MAVGAGCAATLAYNNTPPRRKLLADSRGVNPANFDNKPIDISNARRASQSGRVDDTGKQRAYHPDRNKEKPRKLGKPQSSQQSLSCTPAAK